MGKNEDTTQKFKAHLSVNGVVYVHHEEHGCIARLCKDSGEVCTGLNREQQDIVLNESFKDWTIRVATNLGFSVPRNLRPNWDLERGTIRVWRNSEPPGRFNRERMKGSQLYQKLKESAKRGDDSGKRISDLLRRVEDDVG